MELKPNEGVFSALRKMGEKKGCSYERKKSGVIGRRQRHLGIKKVRCH